MNKFLDRSQIEEIAEKGGYEFAALMSVIGVESSGHGFSNVTDKIIIQFEPSWFKRNYVEWKKERIHTKWIDNKVSNQALEWIAFNDAYSVNANAAMESTSIGLMQVMGFHYNELGFSTVNEMWDYAKESEYNQLMLGIKFIKSNKFLDKALKSKDWKTFAKYYNGKNFLKFKYDSRLESLYNHYK